MKNRHFFLCLIGILFLLFTGCTSWHTLAVETTDQPIQFGSFQTSPEFESLGAVSGFFTYHVDEGIRIESDRSILTIGQDEYLEENITFTLFEVLDDNPNHFIGDLNFEVEVKTGITPGRVFTAFIGSIIFRNRETSAGPYTSEIIKVNGEAYTKRN